MPGFNLVPPHFTSCCCRRRHSSSTFRHRENTPQETSPCCLSPLTETPPLVCRQTSTWVVRSPFYSSLRYDKVGQELEVFHISNKALFPVTSSSIHDVFISHGKIKLRGCVSSLGVKDTHFVPLNADRQHLQNTLPHTAGQEIAPRKTKKTRGNQPKSKYPNKPVLPSGQCHLSFVASILTQLVRPTSVSLSRCPEF